MTEVARPDIAVISRCPSARYRIPAQSAGSGLSGREHVLQDSDSLSAANAV